MATALLFVSSIALNAQTPEKKSKTSGDSTFQKRKDENMKTHPQKKDEIQRRDSINRAKDPNRPYNTEPNRTPDQNNPNRDTQRPSQPNPNAPNPPGNPAPTPREN